MTLIPHIPRPEESLTKTRYIVDQLKQLTSSLPDKLHAPIQEIEDLEFKLEVESLSYSRTSEFRYMYLQGKTYLAEYGRKLPDSEKTMVKALQKGRRVLNALAA